MRASGAFSPDAFREHSVNLLVGLAIVFNRKSLDAKTLWTRLDSAVQAGVTAANGGDTHALVNAACEHVMATANGMTSAEFGNLVGPILDLDEDEAYAFLRHLAKSRFTAIAFAKRAWDDRKELRQAASRITEESAE